MDHDRKKIETISPDDLLDTLCTASSATDCTGLLPTLPQDSDELSHYEALYPYLTLPVSNKGQQVPTGTSANSAPEKK